MTRPLENVTILDLSRVLACPFATMILAELGATVIKVEQPGTGDETRGFEPRVEGEGGSESAYYMAFNRSKQSITVNLRSAEGQDLIRKLSAQADVVLENFPVGTLQRYGLDYARLSQDNPALVYVSCTGFGMTGPYAPRKGYDTVFQAMGGIMSLTGERGGGPVKPGLPVADLTSGSSWRPRSLRRTDLPARSNSRQPRSSSSRLIWVLTADWVSPRRAPAAEKDEPRAAAMKVWR